MTPTNVARGFFSIAHQILWNVDYRPLSLDWVFRGGCIGGSTLTQLRQRATSLIPSNDTKTTSLAASDNAVDAPDVRTLFTGTPIPAEKVMNLIREALQRTWAYKDSDPITREVQRHITVVIQDIQPDVCWSIQIEYAALQYGDRPIVFSDLSKRYLRMLQLPAYLDRRESLQSRWYMGEQSIRRVTIYNETDREICMNQRGRGNVTVVNVGESGDVKDFLN